MHSELHIDTQSRGMVGTQAYSRPLPLLHEDDLEDMYSKSR